MSYELCTTGGVPKGLDSWIFRRALPEGALPSNVWQLRGDARVQAGNQGLHSTGNQFVSSLYHVHVSWCISYVRSRRFWLVLSSLVLFVTVVIFYLIGQLLPFRLPSFVSYRPLAHLFTASLLYLSCFEVCLHNSPLETVFPSNTPRISRQTNRSRYRWFSSPISRKPSPTP